MRWICLYNWLPFLFQNFFVKKLKSPLFCNLDKVDYELHFLFECPLYIKERCLFVNEIQIVCSSFPYLNNSDKLYWLFNNEEVIFRQSFKLDLSLSLLKFLIFSKSIFSFSARYTILLYQDIPYFLFNSKREHRHEGKLTTFYKIKETFSREFYLDSLCFKQRSILTKFRLSAHSLRSRWQVNRTTF
jgi:hypothetical protein